METVATRKALGRKRMMAEADEAKGAASMGWMEVEKEVLPSLETQKVLVKEGFEKKTANSSETLVKAIFGGDWEDEEWASWKANFEETEETTTIPEVKREESMEEWEMRRQEREKADLEITGGDYEAWVASEFRRDWNYVWSKSYGSFEDTTRILPMRFTYKPAPHYRASPLETLQIFSAKVAATRGGLQWPLDVFGMVAMRDNIDHNRNIIFYRTRDNCQTLTKEDPNLVLVGPTRAVVVLSPHPVIIEVDLKVKGTNESEDKYLSFLAVPFICGDQFYSRLHNCAYTSKLGTLEFTLGCIVSSVEATIFVRVIRGSWPDGFRGQFAAFTTGAHGTKTFCGKNAASIDHEKIVLLDSRGEKVPVTGDGKIKLSRCVVSVEIRGELKVSVKAWKVDNNVVKKEKVFTPLKAGLSDDTLDIGFCKMEVSVAWSLISADPVLAESVL